MKNILLVSILLTYHLQTLGPTPPTYISHAGGEINGIIYTNSKESFELSLNKGLNYIEVDFALTSDGYFVLLHEWKSVVELFGVEEKVYTLEEFKRFKMIGNFETMTMDSFMDWLLKHRKVYIITDTKDDNLLLLRTIKNNYPKVMKQIIPQIYTIDEYEEVKKLGYKRIIYTLYKSNQSNDQILNDIDDKDLFAVTMPVERAKSGLGEQVHQFVYCHTINDPIIANELKASGVDGFYTDTLY